MDEAVEIVVTQNINNSSGRDSPSNGDVDSNRPELSDFMHRGYIKLWRKTDDWAFSQHPLAVALWVSLLRLATYKPIKKMFNGNIVTLEPGQLITGRLFLEGFTGISGNSIEKYLTFFEEQNQIAQQKTNHNRLITITNWSKYQGEIEPPCTATCTTERQPLAQQPAQQKDTHKKIRSKEDKNIRNKRERVFTAPSVDEVRVYCQERGNNINAEAFVSFYGSKGWVVGRSPMKDWRAAVRTWELKRKEEAGNGGSDRGNTQDDERRRQLDALG